jgi:hypothetical protein
MGRTNALCPGNGLGPYEITAPIAGGMGVVFRATDMKLKRAVAVKVLADALAADAERLTQFQREAEVLASLNHPNIAAIYGLERTDTSMALVMELSKARRTRNESPADRFQSMMPAHGEADCGSVGGRT